MPERPAWLASAPWRPHLKLIGAVVSVLVTIGLLTAFLASQHGAPGEGTEVPTVAGTPSATATTPASPQTIAWPRGSLPALLDMAPDWLDDDPGLPVQATYADIAGWLGARDVDPGALDDAAFQRAIATLALPEAVRASGATAAWREAYGFDLRQVDAVLAVGQAPNLVLIMPGRYDPESLYATWAANGYQAVEIEETTAWSLAPGDRIDLSAPSSRPSLGLLNTLVVLDDGTLLASSRSSLMAATLRVAHGRTRSLAARDGLREALPGRVDAVSAILSTGDLLATPAGSGMRATPVAAELLPEVDLALFTLPAAGAPARMTLVLERAASDPAALRRAVQDRIAADPVWSARWHVDGLRVAGEGRLIVIDVSSATDRDAGLEIADPRELEPFRWGPAMDAAMTGIRHARPRNDSGRHGVPVRSRALTPCGPIGEACHPSGSIAMR